MRKRNVLSPVEFRDMRERLFRLLRRTIRQCDGGIVVECDQVFLTPEGAELVAKLMLHLIAVNGTKVKAVAATDDDAFPIIGSIVASGGDSLQCGLLLKSLIAGPNLESGSEVVLVSDRVAYLTTSHVGQLRSKGYKVDTILTIIKYENHADNWVAEADLNLIAIFNQSEFENGELDHARFHLFQDAQMYGIG